jgi:hypothetical protein
MYVRTVTEIRSLETPWSQLSDAIRMQFRESERAAYETGASFFKSAAATLGEPTFVTLFDRLDDDQPMWVYVETENEGPPLVWFGFTYWNLVQQPQFKLASDLRAPIKLPQRLDRIYSVFGGIREGTYHAGGLVPVEVMRPLSMMTHGTLKNANIDPCACYGFYSFGNGDYFCLSSDGDCLFFNHERSTVDDVDLDSALDTVFPPMLEEEDFKKTLFGE